VAQSVGQVFHDVAIAEVLNFKGYPLSGGGGADCASADEAEACAHYATDCVDNCTGTALTKLSAFYACLEKDFSEGSCSGGDSHAPACVKSVGIDQSKYNQCKDDKSKIQQIQNKFDSAGSSVQSFPKIIIDGKDVSDSQDPASLKSALCESGVQVACNSALVI